MKNRSINAMHTEDHSNRPKKATRHVVREIELTLDSPKSTKSDPETKLCIFARDKTGYGFKITGNAPVKVQAVRQDGVAWTSGLRENDVILKVNGASVIDKQHKDVVALIRKETRVELLVESDNSQNISAATNSSPSIKSPSPVLTRIPKYDPNVARPNSLPKVSPRHRVQSESLLQKPIDYQSIERKKATTLQTKEIDRDNDYVGTNGTSSECSISTSSVDSDSAQKAPPKSSSTVFTHAVELHNGTPIKSNSYNVPANLSSIKPIPPPKKTSPEKLKNKTIPSDGAKSYNLTLSGDSEMTSNQQSPFSTLPKKRSGGFIHGRDFDDDNKEDEESDSSPSLIEMLSSTKDALSKPGLVAILLMYVKEKFEDFKIMIFHYSCRHYKSLILRREFSTDAQRMANELITTFLLEKAPLYINISDDVISEILLILKGGKQLAKLFDPILRIVDELMKEIVEDVCGKVKRGIQLSDDVSSFVNSINSPMNHENEMTLLHRTMCNIITKSQKDSNINDTILATHIGLATMYQYFHNSNVLPGASIRARSTDCLNNLIYQNKVQTISDFFKIGILCAPYQQRLTLGLRKKTKSVNGHVLLDAACQEPEECAICEGLLWGTSPQGVFCSMCKNYYHTLCKKKNKTSCSRKLRKSNSQLNNKEEKSAFFGRLSRKSSTNSVRSTNISGDNVETAGNHFFSNGSILPDDKTSSAPFDPSTDFSKSQSEDHLERTNISISTFERFGSTYHLNGSSMNQSIDNSIFNEQGVVHVQELIQDECLNDPDMRIQESFDAETEINAVFPCANLGSDKNRLIVLLEFYHKTRYILMNLKRFMYSLVQKWPPSQPLYSKALSLDCITPFVKLIKSLVETIEKCITEQGFVGLEQSVLDWLSENDDDRLKEWISLCSNLCCTNSLNAVKQLKQTSLRVIPELVNLLKVKFHKLIVIEELTQIRPLLISLPLIVKNIIKCLSKNESEYSDELTVWKQVSVKMDYLCEYIDRCCIPLVDWINNGSIPRRSEKFDLQNMSKEFEKDIKDFCIDFPRTLFHFPIFDFQVAKIMTWCTYGKIGTDLQTAYFKKGTEVLLIFYKTFILVLQKENDHYVLKPIKPIKNIIERQAPIIEIYDGIIGKNGGQEENHFVLNIISHKSDNASLLRIGFTRLEVVESWLEYINTKKFSLSRSISLFKSNDLRAISESGSHFERTTSNISNKSKVSQISVDPSSNINGNFDIEEKDEEKSVTSYISLSESLMKASDIMESRSPLCSILGVSEDDLPNQIQIINDGGAKSLEELVAVFYSCSQAAIQQTHRLVAKSCSKVEFSSEFDVDKVRSMLNTTCAVLDMWEKFTKTNEGENSEVTVESISNQNDHKDSTDAVLPSPCTSTCDINDDIKAIVDEIIEESMWQVRRVHQNIELRSYKYVPAESLLPPVEDRSYLSNVVFTPTYEHLNSLVDDTMTVSKAQIVLHNRHSSHSSC